MTKARRRSVLVKSWREKEGGKEGQKEGKGGKDGKGKSEVTKRKWWKSQGNQDGENGQDGEGDAKNIMEIYKEQQQFERLYKMN